MQVLETNLKEVLIVIPQVFIDQRGWFTESYSYAKMKMSGIDNIFVQDNYSFSAKAGTLRGLHFQNNPKAQTKLIRCTHGAILDIAVDIRKGSPQFCQWTSVVLSAENYRQLYIPKGFAHAFLTLTDGAEVMYKVDEYYDSDLDRSIRYDDPTIAIDWGKVNPILSAKDEKAPFLTNSDCNFLYKSEGGS